MLVRTRDSRSMAFGLGYRRLLRRAISEGRSARLSRPRGIASGRDEFGGDCPIQLRVANVFAGRVRPNSAGCRLPKKLDYARLRLRIPWELAMIERIGRKRRYRANRRR